MTSTTSWLARQQWRARLFARDGTRLLSLLARAARTALADPAPPPGLSVLAGPAAVRTGVLATYTVGVCNPTAHRLHARLVARGRSTAARVRVWHVETPIDVPAHEVVTYRVSTRWEGDGSVMRAPANDDPIDLDGCATSTDDWCDVQVELAGERAVLDRLRVRAVLAT